MRLRRLDRQIDLQRQQYEVVQRYREPLARAANELQSRLWNIHRGRFLGRYGPQSRRDRPPATTSGEPPLSDYAITSTVWLVGQYLCWVELLRREAQFLHLERQDETLRLQALLNDLVHAFSTDSLDRPLRVFSAHQRAVGELMIVQGRDAAGNTRSDCLGYAAFHERLRDEDFARWFTSLRQDVLRLAEAGGESQRLVRLQQLLVDVIDLVDPSPGVRFTRGREALTTRDEPHPRVSKPARSRRRDKGEHEHDED